MKIDTSKLRLLVSLLATAAIGCASLFPVQGVTSGEIGCPAEDITITNDEPGFNERTWTAECNGRTYYCSAVGGGNGGGVVSCKESIASAPKAAPPAAPAKAAPPAAPAGCQFDTQCKGNRICRSGACVDAPVASTADASAPSSPVQSKREPRAVVPTAR
jgi:hypothetical protein